jgi:hypothetical protein
VQGYEEVGRGRAVKFGTGVVRDGLGKTMTERVKEKTTE